MSPRCFGSALLSVLIALGTATAPASAAIAKGGTSSAPRKDSMSAARRLYQKERFTEAARAFEAIWRETGETGALYNAGMAREAAGVGHDALAIIAWRRYLESTADVSPEERAELDRRIGEAEGRMTRVEFVFLRPGITARIELQREGSQPEDSIVIEPAADDWHVQLYLDPGAWSIRPDNDEARPSLAVLHVGGPGRAPQRVTLGKVPALKEGPDHDLPRPEADRPRHDTTRRLRIGVATANGVAGLALIGAGAVLLRRGAKGVDLAITVEREDPGSTERTNADAALRSARTMFQGGVVVAAGVGATTVAVTAAAGGRRRSLAIEAGLGGALVIGGAVGIGLTKHYRSLDYQAWDASFKRTHRDEMIAGTTLGAGLGLSVAALGGVMAITITGRRKRAPATTVAPLWEQFGTGIVVVRRF